MDQVKIGKFIAQLRAERGWTQRELAETLGISSKTVSKWECGRGLPEVSMLPEVCRVLGISINELLSGERLSEADYREKAEENMVQLMERWPAGKVLLHFGLSILFALAAFSSILLVVGKAVEPELMPVMFFWNTMLLTANLAAGLLCGVLKRWKKWVLLAMVLVDGALLAVMIYLLTIMFVVFQML